MTRLPLTLLTLLFIAGCGAGNVQERGNLLVTELEAAFPDRIAAVTFEYNFLDPPQLFVDIGPAMEPEEERRFLCDELRPRIQAVGGDIDATTTYGWYLSEECPSTDPSVTTVVTHAIGTTVMLPGFGLPFPLLLAMVGGLLLALRQRFPGLTPILIGVIAVALAFLALQIFVGFAMTGYNPS
jgi:hypothetical protein